MAVPLVIGIAFSEVNKAEAIKRLCEWAELPESEENTKLALKKLAVQTIHDQKTRAAAKAA